MHPKPRRILPVLILLGLAALGYWFFFGRTAADTGALSASGTIEAVQVNVSPELAGRVTAVNANEGDAVKQGDVLVQFDATLLEAQHKQAEAAANAAQSAHAAAEASLAAATANLELLRAGPSEEQLAVAQSVVDKAQLAVDQLQTNYDDLPDAAKDASQGKALNQQLDQAKVGLEGAQAQYDQVQAGARSQQIVAAEAQVDAAQAQVDATQAQAEAAQAAVGALDAQIAKLTIHAPADGVVLSRAVEPGEVASPASVLLVIGRLADLTITVFVPEDRYGEISLGQTAELNADSFPDRVFTASVVHIADTFEFTPRNVQTASGRKTTVFAVRLSIANPEGKLKPGMPADVSFGN